METTWFSLSDNRQAGGKSGGAVKCRSREAKRSGRGMEKHRIREVMKRRNKTEKQRSHKSRKAVIEKVKK